MNRQNIVFITLTLLTFPLCALAENATKEEAKLFFEKYIIMGEKFDEALADLYSDDAKIKTNRIYPNGQMKTMEFSGSKWKLLVKASMPLGKAKGDISKFSDINISLIGTRAKIKAKRYSVLKCYYDKGYYMIIEKDDQGNYLIIEEYMETQPNSNC